MICTIMSDASVCPDTGAGGWGVWMKSNRGHFQGGGSYKERTPIVHLAEGKALYIAVWSAFKYGIAERGDKVILQTDSMLFIKSYQDGFKHQRTKNKYREMIGLAEKMIALIESKGCSHEIRHVEAHSPKKASRNYINEMCDGLAKTAMKSQRVTIRRAAA